MAVLSKKTLWVAVVLLVLGLASTVGTTARAQNPCDWSDELLSCIDLGCNEQFGQCVETTGGWCMCIYPEQ